MSDHVYRYFKNGDWSLHRLLTAADILPSRESLYLRVTCVRAVRTEIERPDTLITLMDGVRTAYILPSSTHELLYFLCAFISVSKQVEHSIRCKYGVYIIMAIYKYRMI